MKLLMRNFKKFLYTAGIISILLFPQLSFSQQTVINTDQQTVTGEQVVQNNQSSSGPKLETGSVTPMFGGSGEYTFQTILVNPQNLQPDYVKIFIQKGGEDEWDEQIMIRTGERSSGAEYAYTKTFQESDVGNYEFYFEAKFDNKIIHGPSYGSEDCVPGGCGTCCGVWGGPKILSAKLISENKIYLLERGQEKPLLNYDIGKNWATSVAFSPDENYFAVADNEQNIYLFDVNTKQLKWNYKAEPVEDTGNLGMDRGNVDFSDNGYLAASLKGVVFLFKIDSNKPLWSYPTGMVLNKLVMSHDGNYIAAGGRDTNVYAWKKENPAPLWKHKIEAKGGMMGGSVIRSMDMTPDGNYFVVGTSCPDRSIHVFTPDDPNPVFIAKVGTNFPVESVSISDDGQTILAGGGGSYEDPYSAVLYTLKQDKPVWNFDYSLNPTNEVAVSADGKWCAIGSNMDGLFLLNCTGKNPIWQLKNSGYIAGVSFSNDGKYLTAGTGTNHVFLLSVNEEKIINDWTLNSKAEATAISSSGKYVAAGTGLSRFFIIGAIGEANTSGAGGDEVKQQKAEIIKTGSSENINGQPLQPFQNMKSIKQFQIITLFLFLLSTLTLVGYILIIRYNLLKKKGEEKLPLNKKMWIPLSVVSGLLLLANLLILISPEEKFQESKRENASQPTVPQINSNQKSTVQERAGGTCGNTICEGSASETRENCPKDCAGEN
jgi:WD40 repeat protein